MRAIAFLLGPFAMVCACSGGKQANDGGNATAAAPAAASLYQSDIAPLFRTRCATCHLTGQEAGKMNLTPGAAIASIVDVPVSEAPTLVRVVPGKPDQSYLVMKLEGTHIEHGGNGAQMPFGAPPLAKEEIAKIRQWIAEGAKG